MVILPISGIGGSIKWFNRRLVGKACAPYLLWVAETGGRSRKEKVAHKRIAMHSAENPFLVVSTLVVER